MVNYLMLSNLQFLKSAATFNNIVYNNIIEEFHPFEACEAVKIETLCDLISILT